MNQVVTPVGTHRRRNPLTGNYVLVSPHRNNRPWLGATEAPVVDDTPSYDASCPLCAGNERANGEVNPNYDKTFVFLNDFGALTNDQSSTQLEQDDLFQAQETSGECHVVCYSPEHNKSLAQMSVDDISHVVDTWQAYYRELSQRYQCVHVFENKGSVMGCSQPHPHGQIWAHEHLSTQIALSDANQRSYYQKHGTSLLADYAERELATKERVLFDNAHWLIVVPYWAAWPFETMIIAKDDVTGFNQLTGEQKASLAQAMKAITSAYDKLFNCSFPYSMGWHCGPENGQDNSHWRMHCHFYPPLLRSATVKKFMVGYEMMAESQRDLTVESAAERLRACF
ncbi:UDP-glucose--hexose-1-phosphate uridylyltransferase [Psychrobium sp. MM17-31]|uniref:UDP-glucose--hexose-1-phosphate uridylyltransferase n=1 Tax=Psychrobium sp. MM17-31 TaxID=2917758 RepID=UPI001EF4683B|nr:UDP-glucose--hexose-1-phosphate uridylyltransferase [Psychrobium sp. MM17-31]MCG7531765.1 UDP-glucose--hexose-1-phosphate uridylyltransferase [Psychrobium sp. MM17-31]